eukprot:GHUV01035472.1.p1 GENE.GHUV01035472.1~~GHUV01035472.1.p1  ORF type:complete len:113 (-),score=11.95 GHUV01035472.1:33-371(-)
MAANLQWQPPKGHLSLEACHCKLAISGLFTMPAALHICYTAAASSRQVSSCSLHCWGLDLFCKPKSFALLHLSRLQCSKYYSFTTAAAHSDRHSKPTHLHLIQAFDTSSCLL